MKKDLPGEWDGFVKRSHLPEDGISAVDDLLNNGVWVFYPVGSNPLSFNQRHFVSLVYRMSDVMGAERVQRHVVEILNLMIDQEVEIGHYDDKSWAARRVS